MLYYDSLYEFNLKEQRKRHESKTPDDPQESKEEGKQRLLFDRTTMQGYTEEKEIVFQQKYQEIEISEQKVDAESISPGVVPERKGGKKPKCFFTF